MTFRGKLSSLVGGLLAVAMLATGGMLFSTAARAQSPQSVPSARFFGSVRNLAGEPLRGATVVAVIGGVQCGFGSSDNVGNYFVDVQAAAGCTTPGAKVVFSFQGLTATQTGTLPALPGTPVHVDLTFAPVATPTPPPSPTIAATVATVLPTPPTPPVVTVTHTPTPTPPTSTPTRTPSPTPTRTPTASPTHVPVTVAPVIVQQGPKGVQAPAKSVQGPSKGPVIAQVPAKGPVSVQGPAKTVSNVAPTKPVVVQAPVGAGGYQAPVVTKSAPVVVQAAPAAAKAAPVYQAPARAGGAQAAAPATMPRLPSTGTGGLLDQQSSSGLGSWAILVMFLAALGISATGIFAYKRSR